VYELFRIKIIIKDSKYKQTKNSFLDIIYYLYVLFPFNSRCYDINLLLLHVTNLFDQSDRQEILFFMQKYKIYDYKYSRGQKKVG
jgi:hypothetical protein